MEVIGIKHFLGGKAKLVGEKYSHLSGQIGTIVGLRFLDPSNIMSPIIYTLRFVNTGHIESDVSEEYITKGRE